MNCPHCHSPLTLPAPHCAQCGFCLLVAQEVLGDYLVELEPALTFPEFPDTEKQALEARLAAFTKEFPQLFIAVYLGPVPEGPSLTEFGFWLINHGQATLNGQVWDNQYTILIIVEPDQREAVISLGFMAEQWLPQTAAQAALLSAQANFGAQQWLAGLKLVLAVLTTSLRASLEGKRP